MSDGFDSADLKPLPARTAVGMRLRDMRLLEDWQGGHTLSEIAERHGLKGAKGAHAAINRALERYDRRMREAKDSMRAREHLELMRVAGALEAGAEMIDARVAAELRLSSESRRKLYALDLQQEQTEQAGIVVEFRLPEEREPVEIVESTAVEIEAGD